MRDTHRLDEELDAEGELLEAHTPECGVHEDIIRMYRLLFRHARDIILFVRPDGRIIEANEAAVKAYGYSRDELLNMGIRDLRTPEAAKNLQAELDQVDENGVLFTTVHHRKDGSEFPVEVNTRAGVIAGERILISIVRDITERVRAEAELRDSEERFRALSDAAFEGIIISREGVILDVNRAALDLTGYTHSELVGKPLLETIAPEYRDAVARHVRESSVEPYELAIRRKDGTTFLAEARGRSLTYKGLPARVGIFVDLTERRKAEAALRESEEHYRLLYETMLQGVVYQDADGKIISMNPAAVRILGKTPEEFLGETSVSVEHDTIRPDGSPFPGEEHPAMEALRTGRDVQNVVMGVFNPREGGYRWIEVTAVPVFHQGETKPYQVYTIFSDITERKRAEEALAAERARLETVLETLPVGVFIADSSGRLISMNEAGKRIWGIHLPPTESISDYAEYKGWRPDTGEQLKAEDWSMARALTKGETVVGEVIDIERFDGTHGTILNSAVPIRDGQGRIVGAVVAAQDVTDLRIAEEELRRSRDLLQSVIDNTPATIYVKDLQGVIILANKALADLLGCRKEEMIGKTAFDIYPREVAEQHTANDHEIVHRGTPESFEEIVPEDSTVRTFLSIKFPLKSELGDIWGIGGVSSEITDRVRAEEALARALDESRRDRERLEAMASISEAGISTMGLNEVLEAIADRVSQALGAHSCTILLLEDGELVARAAHGIPEALGFRLSATECLAGKILSSGRTVYVSDAQNDPLVTSPHVKRAGVRSLLGTSLIARGQTVGVMYVDMLEIRQYSADERRLLEAMAARTALIVENTKLYEQVTASRDEIQRNFSALQRSLLPPETLEIGPGYRMAAAYLSPFGLEIGGDFYDVFDTEAGKHGILIGDVAGKGVPAVSMATATRSTIRSLTYDIASVGEALTHANSVLCPQEFVPGGPTYVTAFAAVINGETGDLCYAGAGHPPPAIYRAGNGKTEFLEVGDPPLRIAPGIEYHERSAELRPGDKILLYTDGLSEARRGLDLFGPEGISRTLRRFGHLPPDELVGKLVQAASSWSGGHLTDDTAVVVIEREREMV